MVTFTHIFYKKFQKLARKKSVCYYIKEIIVKICSEALRCSHFLW